MNGDTGVKQTGYSEGSGPGGIPKTAPRHEGQGNGGITLASVLVTGTKLGATFEADACLHDGMHRGVFRVRDLARHTSIALKVIRVPRRQARMVLDLLTEEFRLNSNVTSRRHVLEIQEPTLVAVADLSLVVMPMELADEGSLRDWLKTASDEDTRLRTGIDKFKQVCRGVEAIHQGGHAHLDLTPGKLLQVRGVMKVADFGIGRYALRAAPQDPDARPQGMTGTAAYMSPEQFQAMRPEDVSPRSDVYALGIILFEVLCGRRPFDGPPDRLKDCHLREAPPELPPWCRQWMPIIRRCLNKTPSERYGSVASLLRDVERVEQGKAPGVDTACPRCGHLNPAEGEDAWRTTCLKCNAPLPADFFRTCPHCGVPVRRDLDNCPCCHKDVTRHFRLQELTAELDVAKQEDPGKAVILLRRMLSESLGGDSLLPEIPVYQEKAQKVRELSRSADEHLSTGAAEQALAAWKQVSEQAPRHRRALEEIARLSRLLSEEADAVRLASEAMRGGRFAEAERRILQATDALPGRKDIIALLKVCRDRAATYAAALSAARVAIARRALLDAKKDVERALSCAPGSEECALLQRDVNEATERCTQSVATVAGHMNAGDFTGAAESLAEASRAQADCPDIGPLRQRMGQAQRDFDRLMCAATDRKTQGDLQGAEDNAQQALKLCPASASARSLVASAGADMQRASDLLSAATANGLAGKLPDAEEQLRQASQLWPLAPGIQQVKDEIARKWAAYKPSMKAVEEAIEAGDLAAAESALNLAASACPESQTVRALQDWIPKAKAEFRSHCETCEACLRRADFKGAATALEQAAKLWGQSPEYAALDDKCRRLTAEREQALGQANSLRGTGRLADALTWYMRAKELCPDDPVTARFIQECSQQRDRVSARAAKARSDLRGLVPWAAAAIILVGLVVAAHHYADAIVRHFTPHSAKHSPAKAPIASAPAAPVPPTAAPVATAPSAPVLASQPMPQPVAPAQAPTVVRVESPVDAESAGRIIERYAAAAMSNRNLVVVSVDEASAIEKAVQMFASEMDRRVRSRWSGGLDDFRKIRRGENAKTYEAEKSAARHEAFLSATSYFTDVAKAHHVPLIVNREEWVGPVWGYCISRAATLDSDDTLTFQFPHRAAIRPANLLKLGEMTSNYQGSLNAFVAGVRIPRLSQAEMDAYNANRERLMLDVIIIPAVSMVAKSGIGHSADSFMSDYGFILGRARLRWAGGRQDTLFDILCDDRARASGGLSWKGVLNYASIPSWPAQTP